MMLAATLVACGGAAPEALDAGATSPPRTGRFGSLRDMVMLERAEANARAALFIDRFEATQGDWRQFADSAAGQDVNARTVRLVGEPSLPVANMNVVQARAFAHWRFARLPTVAEWELVAVGDGRTLFPWGRRQDATRANTGDLAFGATTPVGTFESGRRAGGDAPYDLVGNVREWTSSVPVQWCEAELDVPLSFSRCHRRALSAPALACWQQVGGLVPLGVLSAAGGVDVPRVVVGGDFETPMTQLHAQQIGSERRQRTGLRVYTTAGELLDRLLASTDPLEATERVLLEQFIRRGSHRAVLVQALDTDAILREVPPGSVADGVLRLLQPSRDANGQKR